LDGKVFLGEIANRKKSGELFYEVKTITPLRDEQGNITHFVATGKDITRHKLDEEKLRNAYDELELRVQERTRELRIAISELENEITERKKMEEALRISEMDLENAQGVARIGSWKWDLAQGEITWSDEMYRIFGIDKNSYTGRLGEVISKVIHPDDLHLVLPSNAQSFADKKPIEYRIILPDKSIRHIWAKSGEAIVDDKGKPIFLTGIAQDITERKQIEEKIQAANKELMRFNNAMVGRELRMIELKKEVNELCEVAGQPARYRLDLEKEML
jgi:PAS domain S-box-containing protein